MLKQMMRDLLDLHLLEENPIVAPVELNQSGLGWKDTQTEFILPLGGFRLEPVSSCCSLRIIMEYFQSLTYFKYLHSAVGQFKQLH